MIVDRIYEWKHRAVRYLADKLDITYEISDTDIITLWFIKNNWSIEQTMHMDEFIKRNWKENRNE